VGAALCLAAVALHACQIVRPMLRYDDFQIIIQSWTWSAARANLWVPHNEHTMPLGRVSTWLLAVVAGEPSRLPLAASMQGPLAVVVGMVLLYFFVRRELGHPLYGLIAMGFFGATTHYVEAVEWFAASFAILGLDTLLLALLAAQHWRQTGRVLALGTCVLCCVLAPGWFASGILAGPFCSLYLLPGPAEVKEKGRRWFFLATAGAIVPTLASVGFYLAVRLSHAGEHIMHLEHYQGKTPIEAFNPNVGLVYTGRSLIDGLLLGTAGITGLQSPISIVVGGLVVLAIVVPLWWWLARSRRLVVLGSAIILVSYVLIFSARAAWPYHQVNTWTRYHLFPHLGLTLILCAGLPRWESWLLGGREGRLSRRSMLVLVGGFVVLLMAQVPRGLGTIWSPEQGKDLEYIGEADEFCKEQGISGAMARQVLEPWVIWASSDKVNAWEFLEGSAQPRVTDPAKARRLLAPLAAQCPTNRSPYNGTAGPVLEDESRSPMRGNGVSWLSLSSRSSVGPTPASRRCSIALRASASPSSIPRPASRGTASPASSSWTIASWNWSIPAASASRTWIT